MNSIKDHTIFNSINPDTLVPKSKKPLPFPLENFDQELADVYFQVDRILIKLRAAEQNPVNQTKARLKRVSSLKYKTKTVLKLLKDISNSCQELWY
mgnify:CR=1 FL=1